MLDAPAASQTMRRRNDRRKLRSSSEVPVLTALRMRSSFLGTGCVQWDCDTCRVTFRPLCAVRPARSRPSGDTWGHYGPAWETRQVALAEVTPDVICLVEAWRYGESTSQGG